MDREGQSDEGSKESQCPWRVQEGWKELSCGGRWSGRQREKDHSEAGHGQSQQHEVTTQRRGRYYDQPLWPSEKQTKVKSWQNPIGWNTLGETIVTNVSQAQGQVAKNEMCMEAAL